MAERSSRQSSSVEESREVRDARLDAFRPIHVSAASDEVIAVLADAMRGGLYREGDRLPRERDLAAKLRVSRAVVREAISVLRRAGVVSARRGKYGGTFVESPAQLSEILSSLQGQIPEKLSALLEQRRILEPATMLLCAERATEEDFLSLEWLVEALGDEKLLDAPEEFYEMDLQFHLRVSDLSENEPLRKSFYSMMNQISTIRLQFPVGHVELSRALNNQRDTFEALETRDRGRILVAVDEHLAAFEEHFIGHRLTFVVGEDTR